MKRAMSYEKIVNFLAESNPSDCELIIETIGVVAEQLDEGEFLDLVNYLLEQYPSESLRNFASLNQHLPSSYKLTHQQLNSLFEANKIGSCPVNAILN